MTGEKIVVRLALGMNVADLLRIAEVEHLGIVLPGAGGPAKPAENPPEKESEISRQLSTMDHLQKSMDHLSDWVERSEPGDKEILSWMNESLLLISRDACKKLGKDHPGLGLTYLANIIPDLMEKDLSPTEKEAAQEITGYMTTRMKEIDDGYTPPKSVDLKEVAELLREAGNYAINAKQATADQTPIDWTNLCIDNIRNALHKVMEGLG